MSNYRQFDSSQRLINNSDSDMFPIQKTELSEIFAQDAVQSGKSFELIDQLGGLEIIATKLKTNINDGINDEDQREMQNRFTQFGKNDPIEKPEISFMSLVWDVFNDLTVQILVGAAILSIVVNSIQEGIAQVLFPLCGWIDGSSIILAVVIVVLVNSINNYEKELQYRKLFKASEAQTKMVTRNGIQKLIDQSEILVGDILRIADGDIIPGDGILVKGQTILIDESGLTGESDMIQKTPMNFRLGRDKQQPFILSGTKVVEGHGEILVCAVGLESNLGKLQQALQEESQNTPLQEKLEQLCTDSAYWGMYSAVLIFLVMTGHIFYDGYKQNDMFTNEILKKIVDNSLTALALIAVAVQEGLPVAVSVSLAFSVQKMQSENYLVRQMTSCETMGGVNQICTDKTGTLTTNKMSVISLFIEDNFVRPFELFSKVNAETAKLICEGVCFNTSATITIKENGYVQHSGNKTDCALLEMSNSNGYKSGSYQDDPRILRMINLNSFRKYMATIVKLDNQKIYRVFLKGAPDIILQNCTKIQKNEKIVDFTVEQKNNILDTVLVQYAKQNHRVIALTYRDIPISEFGNENIEDVPEEYFGKDLTFLGLAALQDPLRPEAKAAVQKCYIAGITVRMVTGDNITTATSIAKECNILKDQDNISNAVLEGAEFRQKVGEVTTSKNENGEELTQFNDINRFMRIVSPLKVLARATPRDKFLLVTGLKQAGEIVAVTGDGNNDAPALKRADVGISMGISGTQVAKDASGIILLDDNFNSIVTAVKWGRNIYDNIPTVAAIVLTFVGCAFLEESPLNPVQMLWVNLIIDTLASLALATEPPTEDVLHRKSYRRDEYIITPEMWLTIITQSVYQVFALLLILLFGPSFLGVVSSVGTDPTKRYGEQWIHYTILFNVFVLLQLGNQINTRKLNRSEFNVFGYFFNNKWFLIIVFGELITQIVIVQFGGQFVRVYPLSFDQHLICMLFGAGSIIFGFLFKFLPTDFFFRQMSEKPDSQNEVNDYDQKKNYVITTIK